MSQRYDVVFYSDKATIVPHFCRDWDSDGGCYGTNPDHGLSLDDACKEVADYYQRLACEWRNKTHHEVLCYSETLPIKEKNEKE